jgi:hypothetical protein
MRRQLRTCGCGTTIYSAVKNDRQWIGCDIAILSVKLIREILTGERYRLVEGHHFEVSGIQLIAHAFLRDVYGIKMFYFFCTDFKRAFRCGQA